MFTDLNNKHTLLFFKWITNKDLWYSTGNSAQCYMAAWMGGEFGREWIHIYVQLSPSTVHLKLLQLCVHLCVCEKVIQLCLTLCDPMDCSLPGSSVHGILQARILEWVAVPFSRGSKPGIEPRSPTVQADSLPAELPGKPKNTGVGSLSLLQQIFLTQESDQGLLLLQMDSLPAELPQYK